MNVIADIRHEKFFADIVAAGGEVYLVGGCVRDEILGRPIKDLDMIVRKVPMDKLIRVLKKSGHAGLVGKSFGVIKFFPREDKEREHEIDISLPRTEISTGGGHRDFDVKFDENLKIEDDLKRRDFTMNAIAHDLTHNKFIDPFDGRGALQRKEIITVFAGSFIEDPLRLLRAIQFAARFHFTLSPETEEQLRSHAHLIKKISPERIMWEVRKLFMADKPSHGFDIMRETGLLTHVFPDVEKMIGVIQPNKNYEDVYTHTMKVLDAARTATEMTKTGDSEIMFAALFHDAGKPKTRQENQDGTVSFFNHQHISTGIAWRWLRDHRSSTVGVDAHHVCHLIKNHMFESKPFEGNDKALRRFIRKVGADKIFDLLDLRIADKKGGRFPNKLYGILKLRDRIREEIDRKPPFTAKDLALNGHDIMAMGYQAGPVIGKIQHFLMEHVIDNPELNTKEELTKIIVENKDSFC